MNREEYEDMKAEVEDEINNIECFSEIVDEINIKWVTFEKLKQKESKQ